MISNKRLIVNLILFAVFINSDAPATALDLWDLVVLLIIGTYIQFTNGDFLECGYK